MKATDRFTLLTLAEILSSEGAPTWPPEHRRRLSVRGTGAKFSWTVIGGGRGQWLGRGHHGECGARAYIYGVWRQSPQRGPGAELKAFWSLDVQRSRQI